MPVGAGAARGWLVSDGKRPGAENGNTDGSALDDVPEEDVEQLEESVDTGSLDEEELVSLDDAARALLARPRRGHGPIARLYRGETRFDFVGKRKIWFSISTAIIVLGIVSIILRGGLNLGIEFKGGTEWTIAAPGVTQTQATDALKGTGLVDPTVELLGSGNKQTLNVQSDLNHLSQKQQDAVNTSVEKSLARPDRRPRPQDAADDHDLDDGQAHDHDDRQGGGRRGGVDHDDARRRPAPCPRPTRTRSASRPSVRPGARPSRTRRSRR